MHTSRPRASRRSSMACFLALLLILLLAPVGPGPLALPPDLSEADAPHGQGQGHAHGYGKGQALGHEIGRGHTHGHQDSACGDDTINQSDEACDGADLNGQSCLTLGYDGGTLTCSSACTFDTSACTVALSCEDLQGSEPNDTFAEAAPLSPDNLPIQDAICEGDARDIYTLTLPVGCSVLARMTPQADVDFELSLHTASGELARATSGAGQTDTVQAGANTSTYYLEVSPLSSATGSYDLEATVADLACLSAPGCPNDDMFEPNDSLANPYPLEGPTALLNGTICDASRDYYELTVPAGCQLSSVLEFSHAVGDLELALYDSTGAIIARSSSTSDREEVRLTEVSTEEVYRLEVYGYDGATGAYSLHNTITCASLQDSSVP
ncbi:hypothetical protein DL240_15580 [Lujinxingia litoralis]|uniref:Peptidase C-terminal archaeal/bacterial domain-containing protein n=1 Tax=Lujinxingia litoralis TaxID=2211119 RepID=A0A328C2S4_9DELT|nr:hypothetical protein [Lujinxingia litoralis]RAL20737.1 hypothetical protein DL240_15580 [Lujinxingia litoralis]